MGLARCSLLWLAVVRWVGRDDRGGLIRTCIKSSIDHGAVSRYLRYRGLHLLLLVSLEVDSCMWHSVSSCDLGVASFDWLYRRIGTARSPQAIAIVDLLLGLFLLIRTIIERLARVRTVVVVAVLDDRALPLARRGAGLFERARPV